jgi:hypothetical protein
LLAIASVEVPVLQSGKDSFWIKFLKGSSPLKTHAYISRTAGDWFFVPLAGLGAALRECPFGRGVRLVEPIATACLLLSWINRTDVLGAAPSITAFRSVSFLFVRRVRLRSPDRPTFIVPIGPALATVPGCGTFNSSVRLADMEA